MSPQQKSIDVIHNCEKHFYEWLKMRLDKKEISIEFGNNLSDFLTHHENKLIELEQHLKPLLKWNKVKNECYSLKAKLNGNADNDEYLKALMEKTAFEGQVLWLTLRED